MIWKIRLFWNMLQINRDPDNTQAILALSECLYALKIMDQVREILLSQPDSVDVILKRKLIGPIDLQELQKYSEGTLAKVYSDHIIKNKLNPNFFKTLQLHNDAHVVMMRMRQTHDLWHALTGYSTSIPDELGLQAFSFAQIASPLAALLIGGTIFKEALKNRRMVMPIFERVAEGWLMGRNAKSIFALDWESNWNTPIEQLRNQYGILAARPSTLTTAAPASSPI